MSTALIIVDLQYDFIDGSLAVPDAHAIIEPIAEAGKLVDHVVFTRDWHPSDHISFSNEPQFVDKSWPVHCVAGTEGAWIHPYIERCYPNAPKFSKGVDRATEEYSGFAGQANGMTLDDYLRRDLGVGRLLVTGLATDYCVKATVLDGLDLGYEVVVLADAVRGVSSATSLVAAADMVDSGASITTSEAYRELGI